MGNCEYLSDTDSHTYTSLVLENLRERVKGGVKFFAFFSISNELFCQKAFQNFKKSQKNFRFAFRKSEQNFIVRVNV